MIKDYTSFPQQFVENFSFQKERVEKSFLNNPFVKLLSYEIEGHIVAFLLYSKMYERMEIEQIEVLENYQRQKIASKLMKYLIDIARKENIVNITLEVNVKNEKAIALYKKFSFVIVTTRKDYYQTEDAFLMQLVFSK